MKKFINEFKEFISKGNVMDMAVAVIIGGAFGKIVSSLVADIITPVIGLITGGQTLANYKYVFVKAVLDAEGNVVTPESALNWGLFIQNIIDFLIIALVLFLVLKAFMKLKELTKKKEEEVKEEEAPAETELDVLKEIRDSLAEGKKE